MSTMHIDIYKGNTLYKSGDVEDSQSACFEFIGQTFKEIAEAGKIPCNVEVKTSRGDASYELKQRGTYQKDPDSPVMPSMYVVEHGCYIHTADENPQYKDKYLTCVNFGSNNYKFYWLRPGPNGVNATYGRIGSKRGEAFGEKDLDRPFAEHLFWIRYYEKLSKGYEDSTEIYLGEEYLDAKTTPVSAQEAPDVATKEKAVVDGPSMALYRKLKECSRQYVGTRVITDVKKITRQQYEASEERLKSLISMAGEGCSVDSFNAELKRLMMVVPRRVADVSDVMAYESDDFAKIIDREQTLVNAMFCLTSDHINLKAEDGFGAHHIKVYEATEKQKADVLKKLPANLAKSVKHIYRVIPEGQKERFNKYLEDNHIKKVKQFWHGSRTENWYSIILNSLQLSPDAQITGKMFGQGIYFAPSAQKSWGYTSGMGSYWAHGHDKTSYMGLFATAYGHPYDVHSGLGRYFNKKDLPRGKDCVHAHAGSSLRNDEVVFYDEDAVLLNYVVEFES